MGRPLARSAGTLLLTFVVLSVPVRAVRAERRAGLEHQGIGLSPIWQHEEDLAYRVAGSRFSLFLPSSRAVTVPLRAAQSAADPMIVEIYLRDVLIDRAEIRPAAWRRVTVRVPYSEREFERVDFIVTGGDSPVADEAVVHVGRATEISAAVPTAR
jgi:hypothetical protein